MTGDPLFDTFLVVIVSVAIVTVVTYAGRFFSYFAITLGVEIIALSVIKVAVDETPFFPTLREMILIMFEMGIEAGFLIVIAFLVAWFARFVRLKGRGGL